jgi:hypothetical protein
MPQVGANQTDASTIPPALFVNWSAGMTMPQIQFVDPPVPAAYTSPGGQAVQPLFTGDIPVKIIAQSRRSGQVAVQQTLPLPLNVLMLVTDLLEGDLPENQLQPRQQQQREAA